MTKYACDLCKKDLPYRVLPIKHQVGTKMHDLCSACFATLEAVFADSGEEVPTQTFTYQPYLNIPQVGLADMQSVLTTNVPNAPNAPNSGGILGKLASGTFTTIGNLSGSKLMAGDTIAINNSSGRTAFTASVVTHRDHAITGISPI